MTDQISLSPPDVGALEETYLVEALRSGWVAPTGPAVTAFEREIAERCGRAHAVATSSGTAALHLALMTLGVGPGDLVAVPTLTFAATANAVSYTGAEAVFVDVDPNTGNLDPELFANLCTELSRTGRRPAAVLPVDLYGRCADYDELLPLCDRYGVQVIEDAAEALGSTYRGRPAGSFGRAAVLSFNGNKIMTTSGGGMLLSDDQDLADRCRYLSTQARQPVAHYEHLDVGYNYRLSNLLAALGRAQLHRLDDMIARRRILRDGYAKLFAATDGVRLLGADDPDANCWLTSIVVDPYRTGWTAADLAAHLTAADIETRPLFKPMHLQPVFSGAHTVLSGVAQRLFEHGLSLPSGSAIRDVQVHRIFDAVAGFLARPASR
ncbi:DegT/DnrJ/EryC1/StrS family aminotransferase [Krasilnikovia sp. MM14-A1259]|uniref:DegT/DnrJ/EryC1/StrS family aminotransferase n=1 Tax=Krasilnikovia sp. MM14-A1259 TaxID=3373539 RepID=UPI003809AC05